MNQTIPFKYFGKHEKDMDALYKKPKATEEAQHLKKLIQDYVASFIKVGDKMDHRLWMYNMHYETGAGLKTEFIDGVRNFMSERKKMSRIRMCGWRKGSNELLMTFISTSLRI